MTKRPGGLRLSRANSLLSTFFCLSETVFFDSLICPLFRLDSYTLSIETGFYYLQSRYYDPIVKRFLNADSYASTGQGFLGYNMFAYCGNNPTHTSDPTGHAEEAWKWWLDGGGGSCSSGCFSTVPSVGGGGIESYGSNIIEFPTSSTTGSAVAKGCAIVGAGAMVGSCLAPAAYPGKQDEEKQHQTYIFRWGDTSPSNLTPRKRDVELYPRTGKGLSFSLVPGPDKNAITTIEALNATGVVYAVPDGGNHVSVFPIGGTLEDWYKAGSSSVWTTAVKLVVTKWKG